MPLLLLDILKGRKVWEVKEGEEAEQEGADWLVCIWGKMD